MTQNVVLAYDYPVLGVFWTVLFIVAGTMWLILLFRVVADIFRDHSMGGLNKTLWLIGVMCLPFLGVFLYVISRGDRMSQREAQRDAALRGTTPASTTRGHATGDTSAKDLDELVKLADLKAHGDISEAEYAQAKERILH